MATSERDWEIQQRTFTLVSERHARGGVATTRSAVVAELSVSVYDAGKALETLHELGVLRKNPRKGLETDYTPVPVNELRNVRVVPLSDLYRRDNREESPDLPDRDDDSDLPGADDFD